MSNDQAPRDVPAKVLLVEDNPDDVMLAKRAFRKSPREISVAHVRNGQDCLAYLRGEPPFEDADFPDAIFLDLNMPIMSGFETLEEIRHDDRIADLTVIVLSTSNDETDIQRCRDLRCDDYLTKPLDFAEFSTAINAMLDRWLAST